MIYEDYVSYETAKLLAEKGVEDDCEYTGWIGESGNHYFPDDTYFDDDEMIAAQKDRKEFVPLISLQMAMKWLRKVHHIDISIAIRFWEKDEDVLVKSWKYTVYRTDEIENFGQSNTYEEACEAAIRYCLENLI